MTHRLEAGDVWGGVAAMLVALPSAMAFGVTIYSVLGGHYAAHGALAGILGATALGLVASAMGGTQRLISAPCAPAAAVLAAFALDQLQHGRSGAGILVLLAALGLVAGALQLLFGAIGLGRLIKYMPYPVVSGYLSGVGLIIIGSQIPKLLGAPGGTHLWSALTTPGLWAWQGILVGLVTMLTMVAAPRFLQRLPAAILGLLAGMVSYFAIALLDPTLWDVRNPLVIGPLGDNSHGGMGEALMGPWQGLTHLTFGDLLALAFPALTLAVLLSIDTLKTCLVLDALTLSRHNSNRELVGQGLGNIVSALIGGMPGAGTMGATLVNVSSGAVGRVSGLVEGLSALLAFLLLGQLIAWVPVAALAGILIVIGLRMIDRHSIHFLRQRSTILDFVAIVAVIATALTVGLIAASGVGIVFAIFLFLREQVGGAIVHGKLDGTKAFSKRVRTREEMDTLLTRGHRTVIVELQGSLFFGTADQLYQALEPELQSRDFLILDLRRVQTVDVSAVHMLDQIKAMLAERGGFLLLSQLPQNLPSGRDMEQYFDQVGLVRPESPARIYNTLDDALEWVEDRVIAAAALEKGDEQPLALQEIELFKQRKTETLAAFEQCMVQCTVKAGEKIFSAGDAGDELFLIRRGAVRIMLPINNKLSHHLGTYGRGAFFGEMSFLDGAPRSADAIAFSDTDLYVLPRSTFDTLAEEHKKLALGLMESLASVLACRLRYTNAELRALEM